VHRLLKNAVTPETGLAAYALYTAAAVSAAGIDPVAQGLLEHREQTDVAGEVRMWLRDLGAVWRAFLDRPRLQIPDDAVGGTWRFRVPAPMALAWEYVTSPSRRVSWTTGVIEIVETSPDGRRGIGTTNHCMHGKDVVIERILDWRPPHYWLVRSSLPESEGGIDILMSDELTDLGDGGTEVTLRIGRTPETDPAAFAVVADALSGLLSRLGDRLMEVLAEAAAVAAADGIAAPEVPASRERHLTEPVLGSTSPASDRRPDPRV
jgi:hypothetical protein